MVYRTHDVQVVDPNFVYNPEYLYDKCSHTHKRTHVRTYTHTQIRSKSSR